MKRIKKILSAVLMTLFVFSSGTVFAEDLIDMPTCWMPEHETFIAWYAKEKGWDKDEGLNLDLLYFDSGMAQMEALPAGEWVLGATGGVPMMMGALRYDAYLIGIGNDESVANGVMVRPDSPILKTKGANPEFPEVYGSEESVKGITILCTTVSSAHYALSTWLKVFGLKDTDVTIKNMDQAQAVAAFESGIGDAVALWAPHLYHGLDKGWKIAGTPKTSGAGLPITLVGAKKFCDENPEMVAKFLRVFLRGVNMLRNEPLESLVPEYQRFFLEWSGMELTDELALMDLQFHPVFTLDEQLELLDGSDGMSQAAVWQSEIAKFFASLGTITPEELAKVERAEYVTDKFMKLVKEVPSHK